MPVLKNPRHEAFAQHYARFGVGASAYTAAGYSERGAEVSASRLLASHKEVRARVKELQAEIAAGVVKLAITDKGAFSFT